MRSVIDCTWESCEAAGVCVCVCVYVCVCEVVCVELEAAAALSATLSSGDKRTGPRSQR